MLSNHNKKRMSGLNKEEECISGTPIKRKRVKATVDALFDSKEGDGSLRFLSNTNENDVDEGFCREEGISEINNYLSQFFQTNIKVKSKLLLAII